MLIGDHFKYMQQHLDKLHSKPLSWSCLQAWKYSKEEWGQKYLLGIFKKPTDKMIYGNVIGDKLIKEPNFLPDIPRYKEMEKKLTAELEEFKLTGYLDSFCPDTFAFYEYKTSSNDSIWTYSTAQKHGQILFYMYLIWKNYKIKPEDIKCSLHYIPVIEYFVYMEADRVKDEGIFSENCKPQSRMDLKRGQKTQHFDIKHTTVEILKFIKEVKETYKEMEEFALAYNPDGSIIELS